MSKERETGVQALVEVVQRLRGEGGCPWDRQQTHASLCTAMLEESYEVVDAIQKQDNAMLCEELGDVLLQVVFHAQLAEEAGDFDLQQVCDGICKKLIYRHPHVFGSEQAAGAGAVRARWEDLKATEKGIRTAAQDLQAVPKAMPALMRTQKLQKRAARHGFAQSEKADALRTVRENLAALEDAGLAKEQQSACYGQALLAMADLGRLLQLEAEETLNTAADRFADGVIAAEKQQKAKE